VKKFLLAMLFFVPNLSPVIIVTHGTFAVGERWCRPGGQFYQNLEKEANKKGHKVVPFAWTGGLSDFDRIQGAGKTLTKLWNVSKFISQFNWKEICEYEKFDPDHCHLR